jgi:hypothetical protein
MSNAREHVMRLRQAIVIATTLLNASCGPSFQGIKFRAEGPPIAEGYRSLTLALAVDGYTLLSADPQKYDAETDWRILNPKEKPQELATMEQSGRLSLRMDERGRLYDVFLLLSIRTVTGRDTVINPAPATHPFRLKWQRTLTTLLKKEQKEED